MYKLNLKIDFLEDYSREETILLPFIPRKSDCMSVFNKEFKMNLPYEVDEVVYILNEENNLKSTDVYLICCE